MRISHIRSGVIITDESIGQVLNCQRCQFKTKPNNEFNWNELQNENDDEPVFPTAEDPTTVTHNLLLFPDDELVVLMLLLLMANDESFIFPRYWIKSQLM